MSKKHVRTLPQVTTGARLLSALEARSTRRNWIVERLEERHMMTASPAEPIQWTSISSDTPEGALALLLRDIDWASVLAAQQSTGGTLDAATLALVPNDPLLQNQWHLINTGQQTGSPEYQPVYGVPGEDINVVGAWSLGITGEGVVVGVVDSGIQRNHPDLSDNIVGNLGLDAFNVRANGNALLLNPGDAHGSAVAGIIAAKANNGVGGTGIAYDAALVPIRLIVDGNGFLSPLEFATAAFRYEPQQIDIYNHSWGPGVFSRDVVPLDTLSTLSIRDSILFGRNGLGGIHVFASGNNGGPSFFEGFPDVGVARTAQYSGLTTNRYVITVTGVDHDGGYNNIDGTFTSYPEAGPSVLVAAPTGSNAGTSVGDNDGTGSGIYTVDFADNNGLYGYNQAPIDGFELDRDFLEDTDYTSRFNGTSAAAPMVSGVIALMLDANPNLTWRDVQEILVRSARQNAEFEIPGSGFYDEELTFSKNTWIVNRDERFREADFYDPTTGTGSLYHPTMHPDVGVGLFGISGFVDHYAPTPDKYTNGAGYTVSQGRGVYGEEKGFGHGTVDAEVAVRLAQNWTSQNQSLAQEHTFTTFVAQIGAPLPPAVVTSPETGRLVLPGLPDGGNRVGWWNEYGVEMPFSGEDFPDNEAGRQIPLNVNSANTMKVEWVEVKVSMNGPAALDKVRIMLESPGGTYSELNNYYDDVPGLRQYQSDLHSGVLGGPAGTIDPDGGNFVWTFSTNRNWGERSDAELAWDPFTDEPIVQHSLRKLDAVDWEFVNPITSELEIGDPYESNWTLHFENYSSGGGTIQGIEVIFHGEKISDTTKRVQGFVGIDENSDDDFNYTRVINNFKDGISTLGLDGIFSEGEGILFEAPDGFYDKLGEVEVLQDLTQEKFAPNVTVQAWKVLDVDLNLDGIDDELLVDQFITGHDGNYFFDLEPAEYFIRAVDPAAREFKDDSARETSGFMAHYKNEWHITADWFKAWDVASIDTTTDETTNARREVIWDQEKNLPQKLIYSSEERDIDYHVKKINFLIEPPIPVAQEVLFTGTVIADINGNGIKNADDVGLGNVQVYADLDRNGQFSPGDLVSSTDNEGKYTLTISTTSAGFYTIGVVPPMDYTSTNPLSGTYTNFGVPGSTFDNQNFLIKPPAEDNGNGNGNGGGGNGSGSNTPGTVLGVVYNDRNSSGLRESGEFGLSGFRVYLDANDSGTFDAEERFAITTSTGAYAFTGIAPSTVSLRVDQPIESPWLQISPVGGARIVAVAPGSTTVGVQFGFVNLAVNDYGDLPAPYPSAWSTIVPSIYMGSQIDGEIGNQPNSTSTGDDLANDDEDGVVLAGDNIIVPGEALTFRVTVNGIGGKLNGWIDFNGDGDWTDSGEKPFDDVDLNPGTYFLTTTAPSVLPSGINIGARFRWGADGVGFAGGANAGEVEDYLYTSPPAAAVLPGDYTNNGVVNNDDYTLWSNSFGKTTALALQADGNRDGVVDSADYTIWRDNLGNQAASFAASTSGEESSAPSAPIMSAREASLARLNRLPQWLIDQNASRVVGATGSSSATSGSSGGFTTLSGFHTPTPTTTPAALPLVALAGWTLDGQVLGGGVVLQQVSGPVEETSVVNGETADDALLAYLDEQSFASDDEESELALHCGTEEASEEALIFALADEQVLMF